MTTTPIQAPVRVEIERTLAAATPGLWHWNENGNMYPSPRDCIAGLRPEAIIETDDGCYGPSKPDQDYIVAVQPGNIRRLFAEFDEVLAAKEAEVVRLWGALENIQGMEPVFTGYDGIHEAGDLCFIEAQKIATAALNPTQGETK